MDRESGLSSKLQCLTCAQLRIDPRGARHWGASSRRTLVFGRSVRILTMMQSCASAAKLLALGPFSLSASVPCPLPVPATSERQSAVRADRQRERRMVRRCSSPRPSACRTQDDALQCLAGGDKAPERDEQLACQRDNHRLARAGSAVGSAGLVPPGQCALLLKPQKAPGEVDHAAADPGVAGSGEPLFSPLRAALVRALKGDAARATAELAEARRLNSDERFS